MASHGQTVLDFLLACASEAEADGFQQQGGRTWEPLVGSFWRDGGFLYVNMGDDTYRVSVAKVREMKQS